MMARIPTFKGQEDREEESRKHKQQSKGYGENQKQGLVWKPHDEVFENHQNIYLGRGGGQPGTKVKDNEKNIMGC